MQQPLRPTCQGPVPCTGEAVAVRGLSAAAGEQARLLPLEKRLRGNQDPAQTKINRQINITYFKKESTLKTRVSFYGCGCCLVAQFCLTLCKTMDCSTPGLPVPHHLPKFAQIHIHCLIDALQLSHPLTPSSPSALSFSQHQGVFE